VTRGRPRICGDRPRGQTTRSALDGPGAPVFQRASCPPALPAMAARYALGDSSQGCPQERPVARRSRMASARLPCPAGHQHDRNR
jgi:hypothetical protein